MCIPISTRDRERPLLRWAFFEKLRALVKPIGRCYRELSLPDADRQRARFRFTPKEVFEISSGEQRTEHITDTDKEIHNAMQRPPPRETASLDRSLHILISIVLEDLSRILRHGFFGSTSIGTTTELAFRRRRVRRSIILSVSPH